MANLKNITELPIVESAEGLNLIVNDNGHAKQIPASEVGVQADFAETDENSPAFIKNKPQIVQPDWNQNDESNVPVIVEFSLDYNSTVTSVSMTPEEIVKVANTTIVYAKVVSPNGSTMTLYPLGTVSSPNEPNIYITFSSISRSGTSSMVILNTLVYDHEYDYWAYGVFDVNVTKRA